LHNQISVNGDSGAASTDGGIQAGRNVSVSDKSPVVSWSQGIRFEVLANLAHELRTPIQVLIGFIDILRDDWAAELSAQPHEILDRMNANIHDLAQTVDNMMDLVLADANAGPLVNEDIMLLSLMADITPILEAANQRKQLELHVELDDAPATIHAPRRALRSILLNLALNAIKFTESGIVTVTLRRSRSQTKNEALEFEITDTGPGIDPAMLERASRPFAQLSNSSARRYRGLGLGLAVVQRNVRALGGRLELQPATAGKGSDFVVEIPAQVRTANGAVAQRRPIVPPPAPPMPKPGSTPKAAPVFRPRTPPDGPRR
jgi:signal transduction histidine kinase